MNTVGLMDLQTKVQTTIPDLSPWHGSIILQQVVEKKNLGKKNEATFIARLTNTASWEEAEVKYPHH